MRCTKPRTRWRNGWRLNVAAKPIARSSPLESLQRHSSAIVRPTAWLLRKIVISARLAVLAARVDVSRSEAGVTVATLAVLKALGAGFRPD